MGRTPDIGNVQLYPDRPLNPSDKNGYTLKFYCPIVGARIRKNCGTRDRRQASQILRECSKRLLDGSYIASGGAITAEVERRTYRPPNLSGNATWTDAATRYFEQLRPQCRPKSYQDAVSRIGIAERIFQSRHKALRIAGPLLVGECATLEAVEYLRGELLKGAESRKGKKPKPRPRALSTVNSMVGTLLPFFEYCAQHSLIAELKRPSKLSVDEPMKGRPVTGEEFDRMLVATPLVVGKGSADSWLFCLKVLWESAFRIQDLMNFSWDDPNCIHPKWPSKSSKFPTIVIPPTQKNGKWDEVPMLPGLFKLLETCPANERTGWVVNPRPIEFATKSQRNWFRPRPADLAGLAPLYSNLAIGEACGVSDVTVASWLRKANVSRSAPVSHYGESIPEVLLRRIRANAVQDNAKIIMRSERLSASHVSKIISAIGKQAGVVVKSPLKGDGPVKFASAHDIRRGVAERLINAGVSAETLKLLMRHRDFKTTEKFYGARRQAQSAAAEIENLRCKNSELVGGLVGGLSESGPLTSGEVETLKALISRLKPEYTPQESNL